MKCSAEVLSRRSPPLRGPVDVRRHAMPEDPVCIGFAIKPVAIREVISFSHPSPDAGSTGRPNRDEQRPEATRQLGTRTDC
jgi:hypothetical protein